MKKEKEPFWKRELGTHGENCPHCCGKKCECGCRICRPDLWVNVIKTAK